ncbi:ABC transporter permease [Paenibacillus yonginensis]
MKLEMRKFRLKSYIYAALIANAVIFILMCTFSLNAEMRENFPIMNYESMFSVLDLLVRGTYIIFAAVLLARLVVEEFRSKSITVLFMYPINRKKLMAAKLLVIILFIFLADVLTNLVVGLGFYIFNQFASVITEPLTLFLVVKTLVTIIMSAVATSFLSLIPLYFGMRKHSVAATIVSSFLVVMIVCQTVDGFSLYSIVAIPVGMALLGAAIAYLSIRNVERDDVLN